MAKHAPAFPPAALRKAQAAAHIGVSAPFFETLVAEGVMPAPRTLGSVKVWLRTELEEALSTAPLEGTPSGPNPCDRLLG